MDLSALIFVALAVAWATYLIPKALRHNEDSSAARNVEGFSARLRVLARREPVDSRSARLVVTPGAPASEATPVAAEVEPAARPVPPAVRRAAAARAARRRLRVVLTILASGVVVAGLAVAGVVGWAWLAAPGAVMVAWLVACRLMVKRERAVVVPQRRLPFTTHDPATVGDEDPATEEILAIQAEIEVDVEVSAPVATDDPDPAPAGWDPVPTTLPTYVGKEPAARRSVRTIDLDSTGVWTSGRLASDSELAREADEERRSARAQGPSDERRASS